MAAGRYQYDTTNSDVVVGGGERVRPVIVP